MDGEEFLFSPGSGVPDEATALMHMHVVSAAPPDHVRGPAPAPDGP